MMSRAILLWRTAVTAMIVLGVGTATQAAHAQPVAATASSEWGPNYGAAAAGDVVAHENANYWQTVEGKDAAHGGRLTWAGSSPLRE